MGRHKKKKNWNSPGFDLITNFWWKRLKSTHKISQKLFQQAVNGSLPVPSWFCRGRTSLIPKPGVWSPENQRPITCTNTQYKWYTSVILTKLSNHLEKYHLMQLDQRGAKQKCSGTAENLLLDSVVLRDVKLHQRNLSVAWIDVKKAYDSVNHRWIRKILEVHRLPDKLTAAIRNII